MGKAKPKPFDISKSTVWQASKRVIAKGGSAGVDSQTTKMFSAKIDDNVYKLWNRMASGSYMPEPVKRVNIEKSDGRKRPLGIPTVKDRIAQMVVRLRLEAKLEQIFHSDSYGYRPNKSAHQALEAVKRRCWNKPWVVDLDIKSFFDSLDHELMMKAVRHHTQEKWTLLYIERWLKAPIQMPNGDLVESNEGIPQGGVISPLLANLFMHYAFDTWMNREYPTIQFVRYADDIIISCVSKEQATFILEKVEKRMQQCGLELHPEKTKVVNCKGDRKSGAAVSFDFLGHTFQPRMARNSKTGEYFPSFLPAISTKSAKKIRRTMKEWGLGSSKSCRSIETLTELIVPRILGWYNYYGKLYKSKTIGVLNLLHQRLIKWYRRKYKTGKSGKKRANRWLRRVYRSIPRLYKLVLLGILP